MMLISEKISRYLPDVRFETVNENGVYTLGLFDCNHLTICCFLEASKFIHSIPINARTLITTKTLQNKLVDDGLGFVLVDHPKEIFWKLHQALEKDGDFVRPKQENEIAKTARIGKYVSIATNNVFIDDNVLIEDFVTIYENTHISRNSVIRSGCRLGGAGFQEYKTNDRIITINHYGGLIIGENVDLHNNTSIDRALFPWGDTIIGDETKIGSMVHIGHAVKIGSGCELASNSIVAGSCVIGDNVWVGPGVSVGNSIHIGNNSRLNIGSVVVNDVPENGSVSGNFAIEHRKFLYERVMRNRI